MVRKLQHCVNELLRAEMLLDKPAEVGLPTWLDPHIGDGEPFVLANTNDVSASQGINLTAHHFVELGQHLKAPGVVAVLLHESEEFGGGLINQLHLNRIQETIMFVDRDPLIDLRSLRISDFLRPPNGFLRGGSASAEFSA